MQHCLIRFVQVIDGVLVCLVLLLLVSHVEGVVDVGLDLGVTDHTVDFGVELALFVVLWRLREFLQAGVLVHVEVSCDLLRTRII